MGSEMCIRDSPMTRVDGLLYEYSCHEGNYGMANMIRGERRQELDALGID